MRKAVQAMGYLPFYDGAWNSDHRPIFVDIKMEHITNGDTATLYETPKRHISSNNHGQTRQFLTSLNRMNQLNRITNELQALLALPTWTEQHQQTLEELDHNFTTAMLQAEQTCKSTHAAPWSPKLHDAYLIYTYWKKTMIGKKTHKHVQTQLDKIQSLLKDPTAIWQNDQHRPASHQLNRAIKSLKLMKTQATTLRQDYLVQQYQHYISSAAVNKAAILQKIQRAERRRRCFRTFRAYNKPQSATGGLSHILITTPTNDTIRIQHRSDMEERLFHRNRIHFAQAHNTPCASGQLAPILGDNGLTPATMKILDGNPEAIDALTPSAQAILKELKQKRPTLSPQITLHDMAIGLHKWRETTTTSPSGKHLGIYRTLTKYYLHPPKPPKGQPPTPSIPLPTTDRPTFDDPTCLHETAKTALTIQHQLITAAIQHTHTFNRWKTIHNFFLEKLPGRPLIEKLRVIHLYEADWNLLLKYFISFRLNLEACKERTVAIEQAGGRPGRNAADTAAATVIVNEIITLQKLPGAILYNDAKACFDRIIENLSNLTLLAEGLHPLIAKLHAQTLKQARYYIKTKYGAAPTPNGHMQPDPFYGTGQGAADSMPRWGFLSDLIINAYNKLATSQGIQSPFDTKEILQKIRAFVDDTDCLMLALRNNHHDIRELLAKNAIIWENLLFTIGGKLELTKCKFSCFLWQPDQLGTMTLRPSTSIGTIEITDSETGNRCAIQEIPPAEAYKLLGVHMTLNEKNAQEDMLTEKCQRMIQVFSQVPLQQADILTGYKSVLLPTIKYGLGATTLPWHKINRIQKKLIHTLLPKLGFNRHMPQAAIFAPEYFGGIGVQHLAVEQAIAHIQFLTGSIRTASNDRDLLIILLESYIITSGILGNPLTEMMPTPYIDSPWLETICIFLQSIQATIQIPALATIRTTRKNDTGIMALATTHYKAIPQLQMINNCRLFLRVHTIADIANSDGSSIDSAAYHGHQTNEGHPTFQRITAGPSRWPEQPRPPAAWRVWKSLIRRITKPGTLQLRRPLGPIPSHVTPSSTDTTAPTMPTDTNPVWTNRTIKKILTSTECNIVIQTATMYETSAFSWTLYANSTITMHHQAKCPPRLYAAKNFCTLAGIIDALTTLQHEHHRQYIPIGKTNITLWCPCNRTVRQCHRFWTTFHTAATATTDEAELIRHAALLLRTFPNAKIRHLNKSSPQHIHEQAQSTNLTPADIHLIDTQYQPPPPSVSITLQGQEVTAKTMDMLRTAYTSQMYRQYLVDKHKWDDNTPDLIDWQSLASAFSRLKGTRKKFIQQAIHNWLPTNAHKGQHKTGRATLCPLCTLHDETNEHFVTCPADCDRWEKDITDILQKTNDPPTPPQITTILQAALLAPTDHTKMPPDDTPLHLYPLCREQTKIGWNQLLHGRWSLKWVEFYDSLTNTANGYKWVSTTITSIWNVWADK